MKRKNSRIVINILLSILIFDIIVFTALLIVFENLISQTSGKEAEMTDWKLILVNNDYHIPENYYFKSITLSNGECVDERIYPDLQEMFDDMRSEGIYPFVREGFRSASEQKDIIREKIKEYMAQGYFIIQAYKMARKTAAAVGNSEHQLGLSVDINADLDRSDPWEVYNWLCANSYKYGFILRYPEDKTDITGIVYEPWHYRYVGKETAEIIYSNGLCLEEYINGSA